MNSFFVIFLTLFSVNLSLPIQDDNDFKILAKKKGDVIKETPKSILGDDNADLVKNSERVKRQVYGNITPGSSGGLNAMIGARGTLFQNPNHRLDGHAQVSKNLFPRGPTTVQGGLDYTGHNLGASVGASRTQGFGTAVNAAVTRDFYRSRDGLTKLTGAGTYDRNFGGAFGTGKPQLGASLTYTRRF